MPEIYLDVDVAVAVPVNIFPLTDDTDFKTRETGIVFNQAGMDLVWNFVTSAGVQTQTAVTPTTAGVYDWTHVGDGMYKIEIPASGGASINNDTEGYGWFSGFATGVLPWRGPIFGFRAAALNNALLDGGDILDVNVAEWLGTAAATPATAGVPSVDAIAISGDTTAADNLELQYDTTGLTGDTFPATQASVSNIANIGSAVSKTAASYVLTTGVQSAGTIASTPALDGTNHEHTHDTDVIDLYYQFEIGSGIPSSVTMTGYLNTNADTMVVQGYDWVAAAWVQIGTLDGKSASTNEVNSYEMFVDMVGSTGDEGTVRVRFLGASGMTSATLAIDQIFLSFSQGNEGYDNGSVWIDTTFTNTNTEVGIDGVARNPVSTIGAANTLLASTNLHRLTYAPGSSATFTAGQTDEIHHGHDFTIALGGQDITGIYLSGAIVSGVATATGRFQISDCELNACTFDNAGYFDHCSIAGTQTIGQAGIYTYHECFNESASEVTIDFAAIGATTIHLFDFHGEINFTNMAAGDFVHITGAGTITTTTCTAGTIEHDGFFEYTDAGGNITEQQSDIKVAVDATLVDTNELQTDWTDGGRLDTIMDSINTNVDTLILELTGARAEPGQGAPAVNATLPVKIDYLYKQWRNKKNETATTYSLLNDAGTVVDQKATVSDDGTTASKTEIISGP